MNSDIISRQAVLNTLENADKFLDEERTVENYKELLTECIEVLPSEKPELWIPYLMHKEMDIPLLECQKAYNVAIDYLRSQAKVKAGSEEVRKK